MDKPRSTAWQTALTVLQEAQPPFTPAGEAFWEPGGDVIHYQDGNNRDDIPLRFTVTTLCEPGKPMFTLVEEDG
ncbi:hypothetical protein ACIBG8_43195 [Nonomuraea sp. NPDC050556]|uniref:hypothetical protein n=1 Tax=Nonomuraea sp. NPDC050556 TaxID=3364369 RepID=UPI0037B7667D